MTQLQIIDKPQIFKALDSRSKWLSRAFHFLEYEDLMQDGKECVLRVLEKYPDAEDNFIFKSINNIYSNILERALVRVKHIRPLPDPEDIYSGDIGIQGQGKCDTINIDLEIDKKTLLHKLMNDPDSSKLLIYTLLYKGGLSAEEIQRETDIPRTTIYRKLRAIREMVKE